MKNRNLLLCILSLLAASVLTGCTSAPAASSDSKTSQAPKIKAEKNNDRFDDWKYKGFGMALPEWVEAAVDGKTDKVAKAFPQHSAEDIEIITASGINVDQSESKLKTQPLDCEKFLDGFWVRLNTQNHKIEEPYITVLIYEK